MEWKGTLNLEKVVIVLISYIKEMKIGITGKVAEKLFGSERRRCGRQLNQMKS